MNGRTDELVDKRCHPRHRKLSYETVAIQALVKVEEKLLVAEKGG